MSRDPRLVAIRPGALGDALLTFPVLSWLRQCDPRLRVTLVARRDVLPLARASGLADDVSPFDDPAWSALFTADPPERSGLAHETCAGASVVAWLGDSSGEARRNLLALGAASVAVAAGKPNTSAGAHASLQLAGALAQIGYRAPQSLAELSDSLPALCPSDACNAKAEGWLRARSMDTGAFVAVHPGAGGATKRWPTASFAILLQRLVAGGYSPLLIEGPQDADVTRETLAACCLPHTSIPVASGFSIEDLAALLARCVAFVGNDSGVAHLAGIVRCPTVAIFGPTDPVLWRPVGQRVRVIRAASRLIGDVAPASVWDALRAVMSA